MPTALANQNNFTCGEICDDAWDRTDIQPVQKGVQLGLNFLPDVRGPLAKRRGFWLNGPVYDPTVMGRIIRFVRSVDDALMLEFGDQVMRCWYANGSLVTNTDGSTFVLATPWSAAQVQTLRYKQVGDVIYFNSSDGMQPATLERNGSNTTWVVTTLSYPNGPWRTENPTTGPTLTLSGAARNLLDANTASMAASIQSGSPDVTVTASAAVFTPAHVGSMLRVRTGDGPQGMASWAPSAPGASIYFKHGEFALSNNRVYFNATGAPGDNPASGNTPPVHDVGTQSDGALMWTYVHDGAGILQITSVQSATVVTCTALTDLPLGNAQITTYWSFGAYGPLNGWPTAWPAMREERLVLGSTAVDVDYVDLTGTAGFTPTTADFTPGTGTGTVIDTDAVRRRCGDDGSPIVAFATSTYLVAFTETAEYLIAGSVLDEPITPAAVLDKQQTNFGIADAGAPVKCWDGLIYVVQGGLNVRELVIDASQNKQSRELTTLAEHIGARGFAELAWCRQDETLWARLNDGGLAAYVYHKEQQVEGWCSQQLAGGFVVEWMAVIPGEGKLDTLWLQVSRQKNGAAQRFVWMQSQPADLLFYDGAELYEGGPVTAVAGLSAYEGETVAALGDGRETGGLKVAGGEISIPRAAASIAVGLPYQARFVSLKLDLQQLALGGTILKQERIVGCSVSLKSARCTVGAYGSQTVPETFVPRSPDSLPPLGALRTIKDMTFTGDTSRDPRVELIDTTGYDCRIYSLRPRVSL